MRIQVLLLILEIGLILYLIFHQRAIWEELKIHRQILEYCLLDSGDLDEPMESSLEEAPPVCNPSPLQGFLPHLLLQGLFAQQEPQSSAQVEEMEEEEKEDQDMVASANMSTSTGANSK